MGTKANPGKHDCYAKADPDEPIFVLRARDGLAPDIVRKWAHECALFLGEDHPKVIEALVCAEDMQNWPNRFWPNDQPVQVPAPPKPTGIEKGGVPRFCR